MFTYNVQDNKEYGKIEYRMFYMWLLVIIVNAIAMIINAVNNDSGVFFCINYACVAYSLYEVFEILPFVQYRRMMVLLRKCAIHDGVFPVGN